MYYAFGGATTPELLCQLFDQLPQRGYIIAKRRNFRVMLFEFGIQSVDCRECDAIEVFGSGGAFVLTLKLKRLVKARAKCPKCRIGSS